MQCHNYRPISLIGTDLKFYAKLIANRVQPLLAQTIYDDQVGFVKGREARDNTLKLLFLTNYVRHTKAQMFLLAIDASPAPSPFPYTRSPSNLT